MVMQHQTQRPVQFEITPAALDALRERNKLATLASADSLFPSRMHDSPHLRTRRCARMFEGWVEELGLDPADFGKPSIRPTEATLIDQRAKNSHAIP